VAVRVASAAATAAASSPPVGPMVGASTAVRIIAAPAGRSAVRDDFSVAVVALGGSAGVGARTVWLGWEVSSSTVRTVVGAVTRGFVVAVSGWRRLVDSVVDPHEVGIFSELSDDLSSAYALSLACDRCDRHEALLRGSVYSALDRLDSFRKVRTGKLSRRRRRRSLRFRLRSHRASLTAGFSFGGASAESSSEEMSSRYLS
jgi:hypothetical protein